MKITVVIEGRDARRALVELIANIEYDNLSVQLTIKEEKKNNDSKNSPKTV